MRLKNRWAVACELAGKRSGKKTPLRSTPLVINSGLFGRYLLLITSADCTSLTPDTSLDRAIARSTWA